MQAQMYGSVVLDPLVDLGLCNTGDGLLSVSRSFAAVCVNEVQALGGLVQGLFVAGGIAEVAEGELLDQSSGLGIVLFLADDLLHENSLLSLIGI